jgi:glutaredoxin
MGPVRLLLLAGLVVLVGVNVYNNVHAPRAPIAVAAAAAVDGPAPSTIQQGVEVVMYSTSWCGYCRAARAWLKSQGITYVDHDVEREPAAQQRHAQLNPRGGVPVFEVDGQVVHGFDAITLERAIKRAAEKRASLTQ